MWELTEDAIHDSSYKFRRMWPGSMGTYPKVEKPEGLLGLSLASFSFGVTKKPCSQIWKMCQPICKFDEISQKRFCNDFICSQ